MLDERPLVTVVTATYKRFDTLFDSIDSVFNQDYPNIEYVITDDGSENFPYEKIKQYIDTLDNKNVKNVMILTAEKNRGTVKNLNNAYQRSNGKYIINLSCGDVFFSEDVVSKITKRFIEKKANVVVTSRVLYKEKNTPAFNTEDFILAEYGATIVAVEILTSLKDEISFNRVLELYRMRWQIELIFKRFKSIFGGREFTARKEESVKAWFYGKLLLAIICETFVKKGRFSP